MKYRHDSPSVPYWPVENYRPPYIPELEIPKELRGHEAQIVPFVCSKICNLAGSLSGSSPLRMYAYNALVDRHWHNENYEELCQYTLTYIALQVSHGTYREANADLNGAVNICLSMWTGEQLQRDSSLRPHLSKSSLEAALSNSVQYRKIQEDMRDMYNSGYQGGRGDQRGYSDDRGRDPYARDDRPIRGRTRFPSDIDLDRAPREWLQEVDMIMAYYERNGRPHPNYGTIESYEPGGFNYWDRSVPVRDIEAGGRDGRRDERQIDPRQGRGQQIQEAQQSSVVDQHSRNMLRALRKGLPESVVTPEQEYGQQPSRVAAGPLSWRATPSPAQAATPVAPPSEQPMQNETAYLTMEGESEMDRSKHEIGQLGATRNTTSGSYSRLMEAARRMSAQTQATQAQQEAKTQQEPQQEGEAPAAAAQEPTAVYFDSNVSMCDTLHYALAASRSRQIIGKDGESIPAYRHMALVVGGLIQVTSQVNIVLAIREAEDFTSVSRILQENIRKGRDWVDSGDESLASKGRDILDYTQYVDNRLRDILMHFFQNVCNEKSWKVKDFLTGYPSFVEFLKKNNNTRVIRALTILERDVLSGLRQASEEAYEQLNVHDDGEEEGSAGVKLFLNGFPIGYNVVCVDASSVELGYNVQNEAILINPKAQPSLYAIADSVLKAETATNSRTYFSLFVTRDSEVYEFFPSVYTAGIMIRRHTF